MHNVSIAFELLEKGDKAPPGWKPSSGHIIFDVKMDFTRKARWFRGLVSKKVSKLIDVAEYEKS